MTLTFAEETRAASPSASQMVLSDAPVSLHPPKAVRACLLIHGLGGGPREMNSMAQFLADKGIAAETIRLPGHGATPDRKMPVSGGPRGQAWLDALQGEYDELNLRYPGRVSLMGLSNGGPVSLAFAKRNQASKPVEKVILLAPFFKIAPLKFLGFSIPVEPFVPFLAPLLRETKRGAEGTFDPVAQKALEAVRPQDTFNLTTLQHALALIEDVKRELPTIETPTLMIVSRQDQTVDTRASKKAFKQLGSSEKTLVEVEHSNHILPLDKDRAQVEQAVYQFLTH